jgi:hypothetical protein
MRRAGRLIALAALLPLALSLGGCETGGFWDGVNNTSDKFTDALSDFNPFGTAKKPLPGDRRAVFPEGVPGVQQGVPPELMRGNHAGDAQAQPAAEPPAPAPKAKKPDKKKAQARAAAPAQPKSSGPADDVWPPPPPR